MQLSEDVMLGLSWMLHADTVRGLAQFLRNGGPST